MKKPLFGIAVVLVIALSGCGKQTRLSDYKVEMIEACTDDCLTNEEDMNDFINDPEVVFNNEDIDYIIEIDEAYIKNIFGIE